jgi:HEAT repeat protein
MVGRKEEEMPRTIQPLVFVLGLSLVFGSAAPSSPRSVDPSQDMTEELRALIKDLKSYSEEVHKAAALKLRDLGPRAAATVPDLIEVLGMGKFFWDGLGPDGKMTGGSIDHAGAAAMILVAIGRPAVEPLVEFLGKSGGREARNRENARVAAIDVLGRVKDERAIDALLLSLQDSVYAVSFASAKALLAFENPAFLDKLMPGLESRNSDYRDIVAWVFIQKKDPRVFPYIQRKIGDVFPDVREDGLSDLESFGGERAMTLISGLLEKDQDKGVRAKAARILGDRGNRAAVEPLLRALKDPEAEVCANAATALGKLKDKRAVEPLTALLKDGRPEVRDAAAAALNSIAGKTP